jgi:hypothetical protein
MPHCEAEAGRRAIVENIDGEATQSNHFSEAADDPRNVFEGVAKLCPLGHVRLANELWNEIAEHVPGTGKAVQQQEHWCVLRPCLAIEDVEPVDVDLPEADLVHGGPFLCSRNCSVVHRLATARVTLSVRC